MIATVFDALARVRRAPAFHPRGVVLTGRLDVDVPDSAVAAALGAGARPVLVRLSKGVGTPGALPDLFGFALKARADDGAVVDLLFTTATATGRVLAPARGWATRTYSTLQSYRTPSGPVRLLVEPVPRAATPEFRLVEARRRGLRRVVGTIVLTERHDEPVAFDPVVHSHPALRPSPLLGGIRARAYRGSRRGRRAAAPAAGTSWEQRTLPGPTRRS